MVLRWILIISFFLFKTTILEAQVANDDCINASFILIPASGDTCFSADNLNAQPDAFTSTCDGAATPPLPPGGNEIWYTYVASGDSNIISVSPDGSPGSIVDPSITVITGTCGSFSTLICDANLSALVSFNIPIGTQVWYYVTSNTTDGSFNMCVSSVNSAIVPNDCSVPNRICSKQRMTIIPDPATASALVPSCFTLAPQHPQWLQFTVGTTGTFEFTGSPLGWPNGNGGSQWALYEVTNLSIPCSNPSLLMCNSFYIQNSIPVTQFGMSSAVSGCATNSFCPPITVDSGKTYLLLIDDINGNSSPFDLTFGGTFEIIPTSDFTISSNYICGYDSVLVTYTGNADTSVSILNWNPVHAGTSYYVSYPAPGSYTVTLQVGSAGCASVTGRQIVVNPVPTANAGSDIEFCSATGQYPMGLASTPGYIYNWIPDVNINYADSSQTPVFGFNAGTTDSIIEYTLIATLGICRDSDQVDVTIHPRQYAAFTFPPPQCFEGNNFSFTPSTDSVENATFSWVFDNGTPDSSSLYATQNVTFASVGLHQVTLTATSPNCPADVFNDFITVNPNPTASFYADVADGCPPLEVTLYNTSPALPGGSITWMPGDGTTDTISNDTASVIYNYQGFYTPVMMLTSADGCTATDTINAPIEVFPLPDASFYVTPDYIEDLNPLATFTNSEPNGLCYYTFGDGDSSTDCQTEHLYPDTGAYLVTLISTSTNGCMDTSYRIIEVHKFYTLYIPNAFSPNADGRNDYFVIKGDGVTDLDLRVYNRRGQMVFRSDAVYKAWNGTHLDTGEKVPDGVYVYELTARDSNRKKHHYKGFITLVR